MAFSSTVDRMDEIAALLGLAGLAFVAATVLPAQSEAALVALLIAGYSPALLVVFASIGNTLGAAVNWALGRGVEMVRARSSSPVSGKTIDRAVAWYRKWGKWSLLFSWAPIIGDAITIAAGALGQPFWSFLAIVAFAKTARYVVLVLVTTGVTG